MEDLTKEELDEISVHVDLAEVLGEALSEQVRHVWLAAREFYKPKLITPEMVEYAKFIGTLILPGHAEAQHLAELIIAAAEN